MPCRSGHGPRQAKRRLSLWSARNYGELDQRLAEAREERRIIEDLTRHVGRPSIPQAILIKRSARLLVMITQLERRLIETNELGDLGGRQVCALHNSLRLSLQAIGMERPEVQAPRLTELLKSKAA